MINDLLSPLTASTSPFTTTHPEPTDEALRMLASEIVRLTPTLAETLVRNGQKSLGSQHASPDKATPTETTPR